MSYYMTECVQTYFVKTPHSFYKRRDQGIYLIEYRHVHTISYNEDRIHFEEMDMNAYCHSIFFLQKHVKASIPSFTWKPSFIGMQ